MFIKRIKYSLTFNGLAPFNNMGSYGFFELINTLGGTVPTSHHWPKWAMRGRQRRNTGGWQVRPLAQIEPGRFFCVSFLPPAAAMRGMSDGNSKVSAERRGRGSAPGFRREQKRESSPRPQPALLNVPSARPIRAIFCLCSNSHTRGLFK